LPVLKFGLHENVAGTLLYRIWSRCMQLFDTYI